MTGDEEARLRSAVRAALELGFDVVLLHEALGDEVANAPFLQVPMYETVEPGKIARVATGILVPTAWAEDGSKPMADAVVRQEMKRLSGVALD